MFDKFNLHAPHAAPKPIATDRNLEPVHGAVAQALMAMGPREAGSHTPAPILSQDQFAFASARLLVHLRDLTKNGGRTTLTETIAISQSVAPLLRAWEQQPAAVRQSMPRAEAALAQVRDAVVDQESKLRRSLGAALSNAKEIDSSRGHLTQSLALLERVAVAKAQVAAVAPAQPGRIDAFFQRVVNGRRPTDEAAHPASNQAGGQSRAVKSPEVRPGAFNLMRRARVKPQHPGPAPAQAELQQPPELAAAPDRRSDVAGVNDARRAFRIERPNAAAAAMAPGIGGFVVPAPRRTEYDPIRDDIRLGEKIRFSPHEVASLGLREGMYSILRSKTGASWVISPSFARGTSGKIRQGLDEDGQVVAIKELRLFDPGVDENKQWKVDKRGRSKTEESSPQEIINEAHLTLVIRREIEKQTDALSAQNQAVLAKLRSSPPAFQLYDIIAVRPRAGQAPDNVKAHMVMSKDSGSLFDLVDHLQRPGKVSGPKGEAVSVQQKKSIAALSLAAQGFAELGMMLNSGYAHLDVSPGNIFYNASGQMRLMDFGRTQTVTKEGVADSYGVSGTIFVPEFLTAMNSRPPDRIKHTSAQDVFSLGICVAMMAATNPYDNPFYTGPILNAGSNLEVLKRATKLVAQFETWKDTCRSWQKGPVRADLVVDNGRSPADPLGFGRFFSGLAHGSPELFQLIVNHALNHDPAQRRAASDIADTAMGFIERDRDFDATPLRRAMASGNQAATAKRKENAEKFKEWVDQRGQNQAVPAPARGRPRPLPR